MALCPSEVNKELRERRRALKAAMEEERNKAKAARYMEKQQEKLKAVLERERENQYRRDAALKALQVKTISTPSNPHIDG
jgi:formate-dependent nitrite reductase cytochrome c552 subunit